MARLQSRRIVWPCCGRREVLGGFRQGRGRALTQHIPGACASCIDKALLWIRLLCPFSNYSGQSDLGNSSHSRLAGFQASFSWSLRLCSIHKAATMSRQFPMSFNLGSTPVLGPEQLLKIFDQVVHLGGDFAQLPRRLGCWSCGSSLSLSRCVVRCLLYIRI